MLNILDKVGSSLGILVFIYTVAIPFIKNIVNKKRENKSKIHSYISKTINELNKYTISNEYKNKYNLEILLLFKNTLLNKRVVLHRSNKKDSEIIEILFNDLYPGYEELLGPMNIANKKDCLEITLSNNIFENKKYKEEAIIQIDERIELIRSVNNENNGNKS